MDVRDLIIEIDDVLTEEQCENIITRFENDPRASKGRQGSGIDTSIKDSSDLWITPLEDWKDVDTLLYDVLAPQVKMYLDFLVENFGMVSLHQRSIHDSGYQIQKTSPDGHYTWHTDDAWIGVMDTIRSTDPQDSYGLRCKRIGYDRRIFTYIMYLNDVSEDEGVGGRTQLRAGGPEPYSVQPKRGKLLLFPASWLFTHRGERLNVGEKYLITGWVSDTIVSPTVSTSTNTDLVYEIFDESDESDEF